MGLKQQVRRVLTALATPIRHIGIGLLPERVFKHLHFTGPFTAKLPGGKSVTLYSWGNRVENELAWRGWDGHEPLERRRWADMVAGGGDILDIGSNTATFAFTAKALSPDSRVVAFEPIKRIADRARKNREVSGLDVEVVGAGMARKPGELPIHDPGGENAYSASFDAEFLDGDKDSYIVPVYSVDSYCAEHGLEPAAIKMDVEGFEGEAICGAEQTLKAGNCVILCEWLGKDGSHNEAMQLLDRCGYTALTIDTLEPTDLAYSPGFEERNVLLVPEQRIGEIRAKWSAF